MTEANGFLFLTEADIRARCSVQSFERGQGYYHGGAIFGRVRTGSGLEARVAGTETYRVSIGLASGIGASCICPYDYGGDCKHIVATLLARLHEPDSFHAPVDLQVVLSRRNKADLVELLLTIFDMYPHLVHDLEILASRDLDKSIDRIFNSMEPDGHLSVSQAGVSLREVARQADQLTAQGKVDRTRQIYYRLAAGCIHACYSFGYDFFSDNICYDFATAYAELALPQLDRRKAVIEAEAEALQPRDEQVREMLDLVEALFDLELALGWWPEG
jgi:uncharacterized Zn finger protein